MTKMNTTKVAKLNHPFLCTREECFYQEPFILSYYRRRLNFRQCLQSLFLLHNETANIWTQIGGVIVFSILFWYAMYSFLPSYNADLIQYVVFGVYLYTIIQCFFVSAVAHLFCCHSPLVRARLFQADYCCIFTSGFGVHLATAYFSKTFHPYVFYTTSIALVLCLTVIVFLVFEREKQLQQEIRTPGVSGGTGAVTRSLLFFVVMNFVYLPLYEFALSCDNSFEFWLAMATPICYIIGGIFYGLFIPQRFTPGKFDLLPGQSIMHLFMIFGQLCQFSYMIHRAIAFNELKQEL